MIANINRESLKQENKVTITIECTPHEAELILALSAPLAYDEQDVYRPMIALPEALMQLAIRINRLELGNLNEHWSSLSKRVVKDFLDDMSSFLVAINFNYLGWQEKFSDELNAFQDKVALEADSQLCKIIQAVAAQIGEKNFTEEQRQVYCIGLGTPLTFGEWADRLVEPGRLSDFDIERAHYHLVQASRLRELLLRWKNIKPDKGETSF